MSKPRSITVIGRRWFDKVNGNTYHTAEILVDGALAHRLERTYGYGDQYLWNAQQWLEANGHLPGLEHYANGMREGITQYCRREGIALHFTVTDVTRKRDLGKE